MNKNYETKQVFMGILFCPSANSSPYACTFHGYGRQSGFDASTHSTARTSDPHPNSQLQDDASPPPTPKSSADNYAFSFMVMARQGKNLSVLRRACDNNKFTAATISLLAIQMISAIEDLHSIGYMHRDIKPVRVSCPGIGFILRSPIL